MEPATSTETLMTLKLTESLTNLTPTRPDTSTETVSETFLEEPQVSLDGETGMTTRLINFIAQWIEIILEDLIEIALRITFGRIGEVELLQVKKIAYLLID